MKIFVRAVSLAGSYADVSGYATDMRAYVSEKSGREVALWSALFGAPLGSMGFGAHVEGLADLQSIGGALIADPAYHDKLAAGRPLITAPANDSMYTPLHGEVGAQPPVGSVALVTTAAIANGKYVEAITWGIEIAQHVEQVTGTPVLFCMDDFGTFGQVTWIGVSADAAASDAAAAAINADAAYIDKVSTGAQLFIPGSGHRSMLARIA